jgi:hypothetical protein
MLSDLVAETLGRFLQQWDTTDDTTHPGRSVLTVFGWCWLCLGLVGPFCFYPFRPRCGERPARRIRELEISGISQALEQSQTLHREESRAERRARIVQLFAPVRMVRMIVYNIYIIHIIYI